MMADAEPLTDNRRKQEEVCKGEGKGRAREFH